MSHIKPLIVETDFVIVVTVKPPLSGWVDSAMEHRINEEIAAEILNDPNLDVYRTEVKFTTEYFCPFCRKRWKPYTSGKNEGMNACCAQEIVAFGNAKSEKATT